MKELTAELKSILKRDDSVLVGCGDLSQITNSSLKYGISVAVPVPAYIVKEIVNGPTDEYFEAYHKLERCLNEIVLLGEAFLQERGYQAYAQTTRRVKEDQQWRTEFPHKTIATRVKVQRV